MKILSACNLRNGARKVVYCTFNATSYMYKKIFGVFMSTPRRVGVDILFY